MPDQIPIEVARFVEANIKSVEELELLLLLSAKPEKRWRPEEAFREIQSSLPSVEEKLAKLTARALFAKQGSKPEQYWYAPATPDTAGLVEQLARLYKERRIKVIELIFATPSSQIRSFADAFKLKKSDG